jgi:hypothetical protein
LERYPVYGWDCGLFGKVPLGTEWDSGWMERCPRYGVGWKVSHLWKVMLESAKDRFYRVDTPRQQVPPRIWYGMTCLLIRGTVGSMRCTYS